MNLIRGFVMSLGMFSVIPVPKNSWNDKFMPLVIPSLPLVGVVIGIIWYALALGFSKLAVPVPIQSFIVMIAPFALSGFIHADGYMDTADAICSRGNLDEKKRILKDPHTGAFAVIAIVVMLLFELCVMRVFLDGRGEILVFAFIPAVSRSVTGIALLNLKPAFESGFNASFKKNTKLRHTVFVCVFALICLCAAWLALGTAALPLLAEIVTGFFVTLYLYRQFRGMSGDLCGCIITVSESAALLCAALI